MSEPCRTWIALSDRLALGEPLDARELTFQREHVVGCASCRTEARFWGALGDTLHDPALLSRPIEPVQPSRAALATAEQSRWQRSRSARVLLLAALMAGITGLVAFGVMRERAAVARPAPVEPVRARIAFVAGDARVNRQHAVAGQHFASGDLLEVGSGQVCLLVPPGVTVCANSHTTIVAGKLERAERRLRLRSGHVVARLSPQPAGATFGFETDAGPLIAKGTIFAIETSGRDGVQLRVHEGTVSAGEEPRAHAFTAPAAARIATTTEPRAVSNDDVGRDSALIQLSKLWPDEAACTLDVRATPPGSRVALDGAFLGHTPMTALVRAGGYRLTLEHDGFAAIAERISLLANERTVRNYELLPVQPASAETTSLPDRTGAGTTPAAPVPSAAALLAQARELRTAGKYADARATYGRLFAHHPRSAEARAALVSVGELELGQLGNAAAALRSFDAYLRSGGTLVQEARYGRIRALRKLGRYADERAAIAQFIADYPRSVQAASLRSRLSEPR